MCRPVDTKELWSKFFFLFLIHRQTHTHTKHHRSLTIKRTKMTETSMKDCEMVDFDWVIDRILNARFRFTLTSNCACVCRQVQKFGDCSRFEPSKRENMDGFKIDTNAIRPAKIGLARGVQVKENKINAFNFSALNPIQVSTRWMEDEVVQWQASKNQSSNKIQARVCVCVGAHWWPFFLNQHTHTHTFMVTFVFERMFLVFSKLTEYFEIRFHPS